MNTHRKEYALRFRQKAKDELEALKGRYPILFAKIKSWLRELAKSVDEGRIASALQLGEAIERHVERHRGIRPQTPLLRRFMDNITAFLDYLQERHAASSERLARTKRDRTPPLQVATICMDSRAFRFAGESRCIVDVFFELDPSRCELIVAMFNGLPEVEA